MEALVVALTLLTIGIQLVAWRWAHLLVVSLRGREGAEFMGLIEWVIAGYTIARMIGLGGALAFGWTDISLDNALLLTTITQAIVAVILLEAVRRARRMSSDTPLDGSGEAVVEPPEVGPTGEGSAEI